MDIDWLVGVSGGLYIGCVIYIANMYKLLSP